MSKSQKTLVEAIKKGRVQANLDTVIGKDASYFIRGAIGTLNGTKEILNASVSKAVGITNFNNGVLPSGRSLAVGFMRVAYNANASLVAAIYTNVHADAAIHNGEVKVEQDGKILFEGPISQFHNAASAILPKDGFMELETPFIIEAGKPVTVSVSTPAAATANSNIEVVFKGVENATR